MELKDVLVNAKNEILLNGWVQGFYGTPVQGFCALGALTQVYLDTGEDVRSFIGGREALEDELERRGMVRNVAIWNDVPGRTSDEVLGLFDDAISNL